VTDFPDLKIKALVNFPANVIGDAGIDVVKSNGTYHLNIAYDDFAPVVTGIADPANQTILTWNTVTETYALAPISVLTGSGAEDIHLIGTTPYLEMVGYSGGVNSGPWIDQKLARGTQATPAAVQVGDYICGLTGYGYDGVGFTSATTIYAIVDGAVSAGNVPASWVIATSSVAEMRIDSTGDVALTGITPYLELKAYTGPAAFGAWMDGKKHRGTQASPAAVATGDALIGLGGYGYDGSTLLGTAAIYAEVDGAVSAGNVPTAWIFGTGVNNAPERLRLSSDGALKFSGQYFQHQAINPYFHITSYSGVSSLGPRTYSVMTRGTVGAQTAVQSGDQPYGVFVYGHDGTSPRQTAGFHVEVDGAVSAGVVPMGFIWETGTTVANQTEHLRLSSAGHTIFKPGTTTPPTLTANGQFVLTPTSNTQVRISYRGSDGVTRVGNITLA
jgi:hypothetical protein